MVCAHTSSLLCLRCCSPFVVVVGAASGTVASVFSFFHSHECRGAARDRDVRVHDRAVPASWETGDGLPNNACWPPLPAMQLARIVNGETKIWRGDVRQGNFQAYQRCRSFSEIEVWKSKAGMLLLLRKAPQACMALQLTAAVTEGRARVYGRSLGGKLLCMSIWSPENKLYVRSVKKDALQQLRLQNLLHSTQDVNFMANGQVLDITSVIYKPQPIDRLYQKKRPRLRRKTDLRHRAILLCCFSPFFHRQVEG